jgi:DNA-directed RNA polymerase II subunit RPB1
MSPEEIRRGSVVEITSRDTYMNNKPVVGGLFDTRMGVIESGDVCPTDGHTYMNTPGYFGHIELAKPVFYIQYLTTVIKILRSVCYKCGKLLISKEDKAYITSLESHDRWVQLFALASKQTRCGDDTHNGCGCKQPSKIAKTGMATIVAEWDGMNSGEEGVGTVSIEITPEHAHEILRRISDQDVDFMGFNSVWSRPEWMICHAMVVPPPSVRPSVKQGTGQRSEDDLTHILVDIIKTNNIIKDKIAQNANEKIIAGWFGVLQYYCATIIDNNISGVAQASQRSGRPMKSIKERLNGKTGRVRGNLMGKRVDFSSRSVITPDPNLSIRQLGVPMKIAKNLTRPVKVNSRTIAMLRRMVVNGPDVYPGAKVLERASGESISLRYVDRASLTLNDGDTVHRHMLDGDAVLFNRQPTLHRMSMMCHIAKIMYQGDTFRMNVADTKPYNADFDGDEMNMHLPQDDEAEMELRYLAAVPYQLVSPANNKPIVGIFQDSLLGSYQFTRQGIEFSHREAMNLLMMCRTIDTSKFPSSKKAFSNFNVLTHILPPMSLKYKSKGFDAEKEDYATSSNIMEIRNGAYLRGRLDKGALGSGGRGLLQRICNDYGNVKASDFIDDLQNVITEYMKHSAYSVGISDLIADEATNKKITSIIEAQKSEVGDLIDQVHLGILENNSGKSTVVEFETRVNNILNKASNEAGKTGKESLKAGNRFVTMVNAGSKGSEINISQMISCLGQQNVDGKRIPYGYRGRTLPHFTKYDDSPAARGFVESSFIGGLNPAEFFFHAQGGREGLIDTAVKTSQTGYISRRLIKSLEDIVVRYDMTLRNNKDKIIQYSYGEDSFDTVFVEGQTIPFIAMSITEIHTHFHMTSGVVAMTKPTEKRFAKQNAEWEEKIGGVIQHMVDSRETIIRNVFDGLDNQEVQLPVSFEHTIDNIAGQMMIRSNHRVDITPVEVMEIVDSGMERMSGWRYVKPNQLFAMMYAYYLTPRNLLERHRFNRAAVISLVDAIVVGYKKSLVAPGETVGIIAAQSIGEPTTQMTLNTFHFAGVASKSNVTRGVPRIEEILGLTENPKNPSCEVALYRDEQYDKANVRKLIPFIENISLRDIVKETEICFDPDDSNTLLERDRELLTQYREFQNTIGACAGIADPIESGSGAGRSKWIMRLVLSESALVSSGIVVDDIYNVITSRYGSDVECVYADHNADKLVFRIRTNKLSSSGRTGIDDGKGSRPLDQADEIYLIKKFLDNMLDNTVLRGVTGIGKATPRKIVSDLMYDENDGKFVSKERWVIDTVGTNLLDLLANDRVDSDRTMTNDIQEVFRVLGIEAARQVIYNELREVIEFDGGYINAHHMGLLCDRMTCNKSLVAVFRHGINGDDIGPLAKAAFEETPEMFLRAARHGEIDNMRGLSANVMCGQEGFFGTGAFQVVLDMEQMLKLKKEVKIDNMTDKEKIDREFGLGTVDDACGTENIVISNNVSAIAGADMGEIDDSYDMGF